MQLETYQILLLLAVGMLVGISMSFIGQTGQSFVIPVVLVMTANALLAVAINALNDLITAACVSSGYVRHKQFAFDRKMLGFIGIMLCSSIGGIVLVMTTSFGNNLGWLLPVVFITIGCLIIRRGFPTADTIKGMITRIAMAMARKRGDEQLRAELEQQIKGLDTVHANDDDMTIQEIIPQSSKIFYFITIAFAVAIGMNSGLTGANSGIIITLLLILVMGYPIKKGVGTALLISIVICSFTFTFYQVLGVVIKGQVFIDLNISFFLAIGSIISGFITSFYIQKLSAKKMGRGIAIIMIVLGMIALGFFFMK